jgi:regulator of protease activity HflC (stomatin/prohibitin superfamily)
LVVEIDTVLYFQVTDARAAAYEIASFLQAVEQLTVTTLRNVVLPVTEDADDAVTIDAHAEDLIEALPVIAGRALVGVVTGFSVL